MESTSVRFFFSDVGSAAEGLLTVLQHARKTQARYRFGGLSVNSVMQSGLVLEGEVAAVAALVGQVAGATRHDE